MMESLSPFLFHHLADIIWRSKEQFDEGSGTVGLLEGALKASIVHFDADQYASAFPDANLRSAEECIYHRTFIEAFEHPELLLPNVGRWAQRPHLDATSPDGKAI